MWELLVLMCLDVCVVPHMLQFWNVFLEFWNFETLKLWNVEISKLWSQDTFLFSRKGIPTTPQHTDSHPCTLLVQSVLSKSNLRHVCTSLPKIDRLYFNLSMYRVLSRVTLKPKKRQSEKESAPKTIENRLTIFQFQSEIIIVQKTWYRNISISDYMFFSLNIVPEGLS